VRDRDDIAIHRIRRVSRPLLAILKQPLSTKVAAGRAATLLVALGLLAASCGFEPVYGERRGAAVRAELESVRVALIANHSGQLLRRYMLERIHSGDQEASARYELEVKLIETKQFYGVQIDQTATYSRLVLTGAYTLRDIKSQQSVLSGTTSSISSYNIAADPFNSIVAENDARERAVHGLGDDLIARIALFLRKSTAPTAANTQ
jgi:LPS-assembly lipoprotein